MGKSLSINWMAESPDQRDQVLLGRIRTCKRLAKGVGQEEGVILLRASDRWGKHGSMRVS